MNHVYYALNIKAIQLWHNQDQEYICICIYENFTRDVAINGQTFLSERKRGKVRGNVFLFTIFLLCSAALKSIQAREERQMDEGGPCIVNVYSQSELCSDFHIFLLCNAVSFILRMKLVKIRNRRRREILAVHYCLHRWKRLFRILHSYYKHICF